MRVGQPRIKITREDEELIFSYKYPGKRGRFIQTSDERELSIVRAEISTSIIISDMMESGDEN